VIFPSGITESEFLNVVDYVGSKLAKDFTFGFYGVEDVKQNIAIYCMEGLQFYDPSKAKLNTFMMCVARSRLINFKRDRLYRMPPTCGCDSCLRGIPCEYILKRMEKWKKINSLKRDLMQNTHLGDSNYDAMDNSSEDVEKHLLKKEFISIIDKHLDLRLREDYRRFIEGAKLSKKRRERIIFVITTILRELKYEI
jgi:hypothetical protein